MSGKDVARLIVYVANREKKKNESPRSAWDEPSALNDGDKDSEMTHNPGNTIEGANGEYLDAQAAVQFGNTLGTLESFEMLQSDLYFA